MSFEDTDDMCPNCQTPWKCNGPHLVGETQREYVNALAAAHARGVAEERARWVAGLAAALHQGSYTCVGPDDGTCYMHRTQAARVLAAMTPSSPQDGPSAPEGQEPV